MKSKIFIGCLFAASLLTLSSCDDFLTEKPQGTLSPEAFYSTQNDLDMAVYAIYAQVQGYQCNSNPVLIDCQGDDVTSTTGSNKAAYLSADAFEDPTDTKGIEGTWNYMYKIIKASNQVIMYADKTPTSADEIKIAKGQAYYWRAFAYFNLVRNYGPCVLNLTNEPDDNKSPLSSVEAVYNQIVLDLEAAEGCNLPTQYSAEPRAYQGMNVYVSKQAVKATQAAVYMHMAGWPLNKGTECYTKAAAAAKAVIDAHTNEVVTWDQVYNYGNNYNKGIILGNLYRTFKGGWSSYDSQFTSCHQSQAVWSGWGDFLAERKFWAEFPDGPRKDYVYSKQILMSYTNAAGENMLVDWWATTDGKKYDGSNAVFSTYRPMFVGYSVNTDKDNNPLSEPWDYTKPVWSGMCLDKTHQLIRYSEVLCWFAEAVARGAQGFNVSDAQNALRQVVSKAYSDQAEIDRICALTGDALATQAFKEHGWEVAGNTVGMVTRRSDQLRMNLLKSAWEYRHGQQNYVLVKKGTVTRSARLTSDNKNWEQFTYTLEEDLVLAEDAPVASTWRDDKSIYQIYPPTETAKNPNLVR